MKKQSLVIFLCCLLSTQFSAVAQEAYFIDGYHGGVYGHYPLGQTDFITKMLKKHPDWDINLEVEPETWDVVKLRDPAAYEAFQKLFEDQSVSTGRIEYVNPTYAQSYLFATSGESNIRQFSYGMALLREHFPSAVFTTYSSEEPCFTSSLPYILKSFGFKYASTKNPNTMWGGYTRAFGGELVNWIGPDGTAITTVPRYANEDLQPGSTWQSIAWYNSKDYIRKSFDAGIQHPVGMTIQDAAWSHGWAKGPWLGQDTTKFYTPTRYTTWRDYFANYSIGTPDEDWHFSQEDVLTSLVWGSEVMNTLAQEVRGAENTIVQAEKMAAFASLVENTPWPEKLIDEGWIKLLLSQHHDCWIVPYNNLQGGRTWADHVTEWTGVTHQNSQVVIDRSLRALNGKSGQNAVRLFNTLAVDRDEIARVKVPSNWVRSSWEVIDPQGKAHPTQLVKEDGNTWLLFRAHVPSFGYSTYTIREGKATANDALSYRQEKGKYVLESDLYRLVINPEKGGVIESLIAKKLNNKEYVDASSSWHFNELKGYFGEQSTFISSADQPARIRVVEHGPLMLQLAIDGMIGEHPFTQTIWLQQNEEKINMGVFIDWQRNEAIGEAGIPFSAENPRKAFYDDRYKLLVCFPAAISDQQIYKDAPFDVTKSQLENTYFNRWDEIKHNILLNWVDLGSNSKDNSLALFTDHTTSYVHGSDHPLALTLQYSGRGLWGRDYTITGPTDISYSLLPHAGQWDDDRIWTRSERTNEPLVATLVDAGADDVAQQSYFSIEDHAYELVSMEMKGADLYIRLFNAQSDEANKQITFGGKADKIAWVELSGEVSEQAKYATAEDHATAITAHIPRFGIRTLKLSNVKIE
ncbi:alpha-mannosidase [Parapedobacter indicus]|uniref:Alpha-mannosidase n=2 Tax=Parapedobacter indicus TaxID=1477437 RepID=A0A1I3D4X1_9SPHI|nr:alpha-mannosidase [Parapedobacter indicus]SFH81727.1 alpha-mannosidase [Parapedobacter indicus]